MSRQHPDSRLRRVTSAADWPLARLREAKQGTRVAVVIPARNEEASVGGVVESLQTELADFVDELVVMDSLSTDGTADVAARAGARVWSVAEVRPDLGVRPGKGEALWKSLFVTSAEVVAFIDADLTEWGPHFVRGVVGPLLEDASVQLCRGFYDRVLDMGAGVSLQGGRVTELVARPWLSLFRPELSAIVQPLAGEWSIRRPTMRALSVPVGYGIELSTLLDVYDRYGPSAIAQVDLGRRAHRHQNVHDLGAMAVEILAAAERRKGRGGPLMPHERLATDTAVELLQPQEGRSWRARSIDISERPPHDSVASVTSARGPEA